MIKQECQKNICWGVAINKGHNHTHSAEWDCICVCVGVWEGASGERTQDIDTAATASNNLQLVQTIAAKSNEAGLTKKLRKEGGPIDLLAAEGT